MNILHLDSSILGQGSVSRLLSAEIVARLKAENPAARVIYRDLAAEPVPHLSGAYLAAGMQPADQRSAEAQADLDLGAALMDEFLSADVVVIGAPMYNFSVSSQLKAWIDRVAVKGKTFNYTEKGPEGLAGGKKVIIASSRGGIYSSGPGAAIDHQEPYLRAVFGFFGITDLDYIRAEGVNYGPEQREQAIGAARAGIGELKAA
ncbi:MAG: FMN-dependent NADH-azoreductase [Alphaproteobacteria bacterium]|jgi:FMN-dependent NADH-azoreductase|nr:FMN-dependent NADH-azoreductase [Alphaproteobacteria bacterium]